MAALTNECSLLALGGDVEPAKGFIERINPFGANVQLFELLLFTIDGLSHFVVGVDAGVELDGVSVSLDGDGDNTLNSLAVRVGSCFVPISDGRGGI